MKGNEKNGVGAAVEAVRYSHYGHTATLPQGSDSYPPIHALPTDGVDDEGATIQYVDVIYQVRDGSSNSPNGRLRGKTGWRSDSRDGFHKDLFHHHYHPRHHQVTNPTRGVQRSLVSSLYSNSEKA